VDTWKCATIWMLNLQSVDSTSVNMAAEQLASAESEHPSRDADNRGVLKLRQGKMQSSCRFMWGRLQSQSFPE
jgi:hypothetical protein